MLGSQCTPLALHASTACAQRGLNPRPCCRTWRSARGRAASSRRRLQGLRGDALKQAQAAARAAVDALMLSDAPLLFPPGRLALAAMRSGCNKARTCPATLACLPTAASGAAL